MNFQIKFAYYFISVLIEQVHFCLNIFNRIPGNEHITTNDINPNNMEHETYLSRFKNKITDKIRNLIDTNIANDPDIIKGRKKTVQVRV